MKNLLEDIKAVLNQITKILLSLVIFLALTLTTFPHQVLAQDQINLLEKFSDSSLISLNDSQLKFDLPEPADSARIKELKLWSTFYFVHQAKASSASDAVPLRDASGNPLGPKLVKKDWCNAALEGTVRVEDPVNVFETYNFAKRGSTVQTNCSFPSLPTATVRAMNRSLFALAKGPYGDGAGGFILVPYRTIAVDKSVIPLGTVIYIPDAKGKEIVLPSGNKVKHDGYFFAADVGGAIKNNQIDSFLGITNKNPFPHVRSTATATFKAFVIKDSQIQDNLKKLHLP